MQRFSSTALAFVAIAALAGCASVTHTSGGAEQAASPQPSPSAQTSHDQAISDASSHLAAFAPPSGAKRLTDRPSGVPLLNQPLSGTPKENDVVDTSWWQTAGKPEAVTLALEAPAGSTRSDATNSGGVVGTAYAVTFDWPPLPGVLASRELEVTAQATGDGTVLRVDAITSWVPPRDPATLVPTTAGAVTISFTPGRIGAGPAPRTYGPVLVTDQAQVDAVIAAVNAAPVDSRGAIPCPLVGGGHMDLAFHGSVPSATVATVVVNTDGCGRASVQITDGGSATVVGGPELANSIMSITKLTWPRMR